MPHNRLAAAVLSALTLTGCAKPALQTPPSTVVCFCYASQPYLSLPVFFAFDSAALSQKQAILISAQARWFTDNPYEKVYIAGNTDERGTETYNLALGQRRADAVRNILIADGIFAGRIKTRSNGKERPMATGHDEKSWQLNRNAVISDQIYDPQLRT